MRATRHVVEDIFPDTKVASNFTKRPENDPNRAYRWCILLLYGLIMERSKKILNAELFCLCRFSPEVVVMLFA
jgi:hypothetical protein